MGYGVKAIDAVTAFVLWLCVVLLLAIVIMAAQGVASLAYGQELPPGGPFVATATPAATPALAATPDRWGDYDFYLPVVKR